VKEVKEKKAKTPKSAAKSAAKSAPKKTPKASPKPSPKAPSPAAASVEDEDDELYNPDEFDDDNFTDFLYQCWLLFPFFYLFYCVRPF